MFDVFKGKNIAFVGQAPNIVGKGLGQEINSFDVVYRTNFFPVPNTDDYGSRCDVISVLKEYHHTVSEHAVQNLVLFDDLETYRRKYLITDQERSDIRQWAIHNYSMDIKDATAGMVAYWLAKKFEAKSIKFFGITGYQNIEGEVVNHDIEKHYNEWYTDKAGNFEQALQVDMATYECHNFASQNLLFAVLLRDGLIQMDQFSTQYFQLK